MNDKALTDLFDVHLLFENIYRWQRDSGGDVDAVAYATAEKMIESYRRMRKRRGNRGLYAALRNLLYMRDSLEQVVSDPQSERMQRIRMIVAAELSASQLTHDAIRYHGYVRLNLKGRSDEDQDTALQPTGSAD